MEKKLKIAFCILVITLISVIAFAGVYTKDGNFYKGVLPEYILGSELKGKRITYFEPSEEDKESITEDNLRTVKTIFENRLKESKADDYLIRIDNEKGNVVVELADNDNTDTYLQYLLFKGDLSVVDTADETNLLNRADVTNASVSYESSKSNEITVYLDIMLNEEGTKKLEEISQKYLEKQDEDEEQKTVTIMIEGTKLQEMHFDETITDGKLRVTIGSGSNNNVVNSYINEAGFIAYIINNGEVPLTYTVSTSEFVGSQLRGNTLYLIITVLCVAVVLLILYFVFKYKLDGLYAGISVISAIAILLLLLRYTKTVITLGGIAAIVTLIITEVYFILTILNIIKKDSSIDNTKSTTIGVYLKRLDVIIALLIIAIVFTFMKDAKIYSIGMTLFYGIISLAMANLVFMRTMLIERRK